MLAQEQNNLGTTMFILRQVRRKDLNIIYRDHYREYQQKLAYEINCWKSSSYERELETREERILPHQMEHSRGMSL